MSDLALYRKYRPQAFAEVIGQEHVVVSLQGAIEQGRVAHAYLFAGSRGTGKTSLARILARALKTEPEDLYELDAASSRGIDEIRELREAVQGRPFRSPYKVYIIDEVHMLTKEAFNALLKTLEEPPAHVIFVLATTEVNKLPGTVVSRCQHFTFRQPSLAELGEAVNRIAKKEKLPVETGARELIALLGDGSFRDTIGLLQKVISATGGTKISRADVERVAGVPKSEQVEALIKSILDQNTERGLQVVHQISSQNQDFKIFLKLVMQTLRQALLSKYAPGLFAELAEQISAEEKKLAAELAAHPRAKIISAILRELLAVYEETSRASVSQLPLELALVKLAYSADSADGSGKSS